MSGRRRVHSLIALSAIACGLLLFNACDGGGSPRATLEGVSDCNDPLSDLYPCDDTPTDDDDGGPGDDENGPGDDESDEDRI